MKNSDFKNQLFCRSRIDKVILKVFVILIFTLSINPQCRQIKSPEQGIVTFISGDVKLDGKPAVIGSSAGINSIITTGSKSAAVIQFNDVALITVKSNSSLSLSSVSLSGSGKSEFTLENGEVFCKIKKNNNFTIKTPTITASVRGTAFLIRQKRGEGSADCSVLDGTVSVVKTAKAASVDDKNSGIKETAAESVGILLQAGYRVAAEQEKLGKPVLLNEKQKENLIKLDSIKFVDESALPQMKSAEAVKPQPVMDGNLEKEIPVMNTLEDDLVVFNFDEFEQTYSEKLKAIKIKNHGRLDIIKFRDGSEITGMIVERGLVYKIETPKGMITVQAEKIESQTITH